MRKPTAFDQKVKAFMGTKWATVSAEDKKIIIEIASCQKKLKVLTKSYQKDSERELVAA